MALTKADLAETLFEELGLNKREAKEFVELFFEEVRRSLEAGDPVKLSGTSNCETSESDRAATRRPARRFRSPRAAL